MSGNSYVISVSKYNTFKVTLAEITTSGIQI